jgi:hypothetical protein
MHVVCLSHPCEYKQIRLWVILLTLHM